MTAAAGFLDLFADRARRCGGRIFARFDGAPVTFADLDRRSAALAAALARRGLRAGDRVAVMLRNSPACVVVLLALARAGLVWVPVNVQQRGAGLRYVLEHARPALAVAEADLVATLADAGGLPEGAPILRHGDPGAGPSLEALVDSGEAFAAPPPAPDAVLAISYTSGTTGPPKGVPVTHAMLRFAAEAVLLTADPRPGDVMFMWEPLHHIGGAQMIVVPLLRDVELAMVPRFSASRFWADVVATRATHIHYLGGILQILLKQPPGPFDRAHRVRVAWGAGCLGETWTTFPERFGVAIRECYGMTEASSITTCNTAGIPGAVGTPVPWLDVAIERDGRPVPAGERGEIVVAAVQPGALFAGYVDAPDATARALRGGRLHTGDLGSLDASGNLVFHGRMSDGIRCKGENVSAWEVEHVVAGHPAVESCAVIGVPAETGESDIKLFVKAKAGVTLDLCALSTWIGVRVALYQRPRYIAVVADFERTASERIMKHRLPSGTGDCWDRLAR
ncbi:MAG: AMP-binding protein [Alphaproteobacteria bacterium]|nr:AMP-binding protein [Alphaproteobacteria bacterium]